MQFRIGSFGFQFPHIGWLPLGLIVFIVGMSCSNNFNGFMMEIVR